MDNSSLTKSIVAGIGAIVMVVLLYFGNQYINTQVNIVHVIVPNRFIPPSTIITEDLLDIVPKPEGAVTEDMIIDIEEIVGKEALVPLGAWNTVYSWQFSEPGLYPSENEIVVAFPSNYYITVPGSLRRGDRVIFTAYNEETGHTVEDIFPNQIIRALYVKQSSNQEIVSVANDQNSNYVLAPENYETYRYNASGAIDKSMIEYALTSEQIARINDYFNNGYRFILGYSVVLPSKGDPNETK